MFKEFIKKQNHTVPWETMQTSRKRWRNKCTRLWCQQVYYATAIGKELKDWSSNCVNNMHGKMINIQGHWKVHIIWFTCTLQQMNQKKQNLVLIYNNKVRKKVQKRRKERVTCVARKTVLRQHVQDDGIQKKNGTIQTSTRSIQEDQILELLSIKPGLLL